VVGAGAAGTMAAIFAASAGADTVLLERTPDGGRKILISGGGRCNILPSHLDESRFVSESAPHLVRRFLRSWPLREQIAFFERDVGVPLVEERASAKLFPRSQRAADVRDRLYALARQRGASIHPNALVTGLVPGASGWVVNLDGGDPIAADAVVLATGGLSVPKTGSDGIGLRIAAHLGHDLRSTYPALTPLTASPAPFAALSGISLPVTLSARTDTRSSTANGGFLFTHAGYSGPAVLDVSHVAVRSRLEGGTPARVSVRWTTKGRDAWREALEPRGSRTVLSAISTELPARLAEALIEDAGIDARLALANLTRHARLELIERLVDYPLPWTGDEGYRKGEVTGGGVNLAAVDHRTMESRVHRGLFLCGEMLDAFGPIGGYNFFWAWATGRLAGLASGSRLRVPGSKVPGSDRE
jgi:predicted Rossmann fold flavoprotein